MLHCCTGGNFTGGHGTVISRMSSERAAMVEYPLIPCRVRSSALEPLSDEHGERLSWEALRPEGSVVENEEARMIQDLVTFKGQKVQQTGQPSKRQISPC